MTLTAINRASAKAISAKDTISRVVNRRRTEVRTEAKVKMDELRGKPMAEVGLQVRFGKPIPKAERKGRAKINRVEESE